MRSMRDVLYAWESPLAFGYVWPSLAGRPCTTIRDALLGRWAAGNAALYCRSKLASGSADGVLALTRGAVTTLPALGRGEFGNNVELRLHHRHDHQLREPFHRLQREGHVAAVPRTDHELAL